MKITLGTIVVLDSGFIGEVVARRTIPHSGGWTRVLVRCPGAGPRDARTGRYTDATAWFDSDDVRALNLAEMMANN